MMRIKNLYLSIITVVLFATCNAQIQAYYSTLNNTPVYYGGTFLTQTTNGSCPSTYTGSYFIDIPNNGNPGSGIALGENAIITNVANITGDALWAIPSQGGSGNKYVIPFCDNSGNPLSSGSINIAETGFINPAYTTVIWSINTTTNTVSLTFF